MSFELALGLWAVVTFCALVGAVYLIAVLAPPDLLGTWRTLLRRR